MAKRLDGTREKASAFLLVLLASSACDSTTVVRTTARGVHEVEYSCAVQATEVEFRDARVDGEPAKNRVVVVFSPNGSINLAPTAPGKGELSAESIWFGKPKSEQLARMEELQRRALRAVLGRCGQPGPVNLSCWSSRGPVSGGTCFGLSRSE